MNHTRAIVILDFGGQYTQLIARRVRECQVYSEVVPWSVSADAIKARQPMGIILSGGPASVTDPDAPHCDPAIYDLGVPVLGICYGMQLTALLLGGAVEKAKEREYGRVTVRCQRTKWGSCTSQGNLNFNCLLMLCPPEVIDSVVVHELCHRKEMNHSPRFWAEVEKILPDYKISRKWLKDHGEVIMRRMTG